jgi:ribonuclease P protein component
MNNEAHLSAEQTRAQAPSWLPFPHGDQGRPQGSGPPSRPWPQEAFGLSEALARPSEKRLSLDRLRKRADFLRAAQGIRAVAGAVTLETCPTPEPLPGHLRIGFTASRKVGNAVARNRAKRRLRAAAAALLPLLGRTGHDYVLVARPATVTRPYNVLLADIAEALRKAHLKQGRVHDEH